MRNQFSDKSEALLRQKVMRSLDEKRSEFSEKWLTRDGFGFKLAVTIGWVTAVYNLIVFLAQTFGLWLLAIDNYSAYIADARTITICCVVIVVSIVLMFFKLRFSSSVATLLFGVFYLINSHALWLNEVVYNSKQLTSIYIFIPSTLIALAVAIYIIAVIVLGKAQFKAEYNRLIDKIVATYSNSDGEVTTQEQWDKYINDYMEPVEHIKPKKSLRKKATKQKTEVE